MVSVCTCSHNGLYQTSSKTNLLNSLIYKNCFGWLGSSGYERMNEMHLSMFLFVSNRARGKRSRYNGSLCFQLVVFFVSSKIIYDIHIT